MYYIITFFVNMFFFVNCNLTNTSCFHSVSPTQDSKISTSQNPPQAITLVNDCANGLSFN